ncbi:hypothetical protein PPROV_000022700 [Pycnococcus provasolii]|uniref:Uncharacterized protein n=1 Tax=Pycnococcus provasolii TaxID=41880 RepID=A0A830H707_9CHLO|nr:hypothetical protein PPROV_000022700 [Pycnococcus provasolii]
MLKLENVDQRTLNMETAERLKKVASTFSDEEEAGEEHETQRRCGLGFKEAALAAAEEKAASAPKRRKKKKALPICVNLANCKYDVVRTVLKKLSWKEVGDDDHWHLYWTDTSVAIERVMRLSKTQKINHFTGKTEPKKWWPPSTQIAPN